MKFVKSMILMFALAFSGVGSAVAQNDLASMINRLPGESNSVFLINGKALDDAPPAVMEKWKTAYSAANNSSPLSLPEGLQYAVMATDFDIQHMHPLKQAVVLTLSEALDAESIAKARNGVVDRIGDNEIVWINDACVFVNSDKMVTVVSPLNRQSAARMLQRSDNSSSSLTPYLNDAAKRFGEGSAQIVMAVDLSNFFPESTVRRAVEQSGVFKNANADDITKIITSLRGVTIESELVYESCAISIDFGENISALKPFAEEFVNKALTAAGAKLGDPANWKMDVRDQRISLTGKLTPSIMQRIFSLNTLAGVAGQSQLTSDDPDDSPSQPDETAETKEPYRPTANERLEQMKLKRKVRANKKYFKQITDMLNDLAQGHATNTLNDDALWISNYNRALMASPSKDVDPILVEHGKFVSRSLENIVGTLHMTGDRIVEQANDNRGSATGTEVTAIPTRRYNFGGHVRYRYAPMFRSNMNFGATSQENWEMQDREIASANTKASGILSQVYEDHERVRQELTRKYGEEF